MPPSPASYRLVRVTSSVATFELFILRARTRSILVFPSLYFLLRVPAGHQVGVAATGCPHDTGGGVRPAPGQGQRARSCIASKRVRPMPEARLRDATRSP